MPETPEQWLVTRFERSGRAFSRQLITGPEFTSALFDEFTGHDRTYPDLIPTLWELIPECARCEFISALRSAILPDFTYHAFEMGGGRGLTEEERRFQQVQNAKRVQTWAVEILRFLDSKSTPIE